MNFNQIHVGGPNDGPAVTSTISSDDYNFSAPQAYGWVCPKCGRVYSPSTTMCIYCGGNSNTVPIKIDKETNPLLYQFSAIIDAASHYRDGCMTKEDEEIFNQYLAQK